MTTLNQALCADERLNQWAPSFSERCRQIADAALRAVGPFYGYGVTNAHPEIPAIVMDERAIVEGFRYCCEAIDSLEQQREAILINEDIGERLKVLFRHLPGVIERDGWSAEIIACAGYAYETLACADYKRCETPLNILYSEVLSDSRRLESIPQGVAGALLKILLRWEDLGTVVDPQKPDAFTTDYWRSTLSIGREVAHKIAPVLNGAPPVGVGGNVGDERAVRNFEAAKLLLNESDLMKALLAA